MGNFFSPLNQSSGEKNGEEDLGDIPDPTQGQNSPGSPDQPKQDGIPIPPPPGGGGTIATNSPAQPYVAGAGFGSGGTANTDSVAGTSCGLYSYLLVGKIRPPQQADASCVSSITLQSMTVLVKQVDSQWVPQKSLQGYVDSCGGFSGVLQYSCSLPSETIKLKVGYGYEGVSYELMSDEIILPNEPVIAPSPGNALSKAFIQEAKWATIG